MGRIHLFEVHDSGWCPQVLRAYARDYLGAAEDAGKVYDAVLPTLADAVERSGATTIVDLCSGGRGPWLAWADRKEPITAHYRVVLTDLFPASASPAIRDSITLHASPVDARDVPDELTGFRTLFTCFHHFRPNDARAILRAACEKGEGVAVFEATERTPVAVGFMVLSPLMVWLLTPTIRPFRWTRLLWTYLIPVLPLIVLFDGIVSCLRSYRVDELEALAREADPAYAWNAGRLPIPSSPLYVTYLIGVPPERDEAA